MEARTSPGNSSSGRSLVNCSVDGSAYLLYMGGSFRLLTLRHFEVQRLDALGQLRVRSRTQVLNSRSIAGSGSSLARNVSSARFCAVMSRITHREWMKRSPSHNTFRVDQNLPD